MVILLDIYGVIVRESKVYNYLFRAFQEFGVRISKRSLMRIWHKVRIGEWDILDIVGKEIYRRFIELHEENEDFGGFLDFLREKDIGWGVLSNIDERTYREPKKKFSWNPKYEIISGRLGIPKPDPVIFERAKEVVGEDFIFIDDKRKNVTIARSIGIKAFLFKGFENLKRMVKRFL